MSKQQTKTNTYPIQVGSIGTVRECELINWRENRVMFTSYHDGKIYFFLIKTKKKTQVHIMLPLGLGARVL